MDSKTSIEQDSGTRTKLNEEQIEATLEFWVRKGLMGKAECPATGEQKYIALPESEELP